MAVSTQRMSGVETSQVTTGAERRIVSSVRTNMHRRATTSDPIPYGGRRMLEGPMYVRMGELRNSEIVEKRASQAAGDTW